MGGERGAGKAPKCQIKECVTVQSTVKPMKIMKKRNEFQKTFQCFQMDQLGQNKGRGNQGVLREQKPTPQWQQGRQKINETVGGNNQQDPRINQTGTEEAQKKELHFFQLEKNNAIEKLRLGGRLLNAVGMNILGAQTSIMYLDLLEQIPLTELQFILVL